MVFTEKQVKDYVQKYRGLNYTDDQIRQSLTNSGVDVGMISKVLSAKTPSKWLILIPVAFLVILGLVIGAYLVYDQFTPVSEIDKDQFIDLRDTGSEVECYYDKDCNSGYECSSGECVKVTTTATSASTTTKNTTATLIYPDYEVDGLNDISINNNYLTFNVDVINKGSGSSDEDYYLRCMLSSNYSSSLYYYGYTESSASYLTTNETDDVNCNVDIGLFYYSVLNLHYPLEMEVMVTVDYYNNITETTETDNTDTFEFMLNVSNFTSAPTLSCDSYVTCLLYLGDGYSCVSGSCSYGVCESDDDCDTGYVCDETFDICIAETESVANVSSEPCNESLCNGYTCNVVDDECYTECESDNKCSDGYTCSGGECLEEASITCVDSACGAYICDMNNDACYTGTCVDNSICAYRYVCDSTSVCSLDSDNDGTADAEEVNTCTYGSCGAYECNSYTNDCYDSCTMGSAECLFGYICDSNSKCSLDSDMNGIADKDEGVEYTCDEIPTCANGVDDDIDGLVDLEDSGCLGWSDSELVLSAVGEYDSTLPDLTLSCLSLDCGNYACDTSVVACYTSCLDNNRCNTGYACFENLCSIDSDGDGVADADEALTYGCNDLNDNDNDGKYDYYGICKIITREYYSTGLGVGYKDTISYKSCTQLIASGVTQQLGGFTCMTACEEGYDNGEYLNYDDGCSGLTDKSEIKIVSAPKFVPEEESILDKIIKFFIGDEEYGAAE